MLAGGSRWLFPSPMVDDAPIEGHALAVAMRRFTEKLKWADPPSPHDLRRTFATRLAALGIPQEDRDALMNHTPRGVGKRHYDLYDREREKRQALQTWAAALANIVA
jgi:integrase